MPSPAISQILRYKPETSTWMTFKTDNTSTDSSNNNQVKLPLVSTGTYNMIVDWGDGLKDRITAYNQAETTHTYASIGTYNVKIDGTCYGWRYNNTGDKLKLLNIKRWGRGFRLGNSNGYFYGCANMQITSTDMLDVTGLTTCANMFVGCTSFNSSMAWLNTTNVNNMSSMFESCSKFNQSISNFNTINVANMAYMMRDCSEFNQSISNFNTSNVISMSNMLRGCAKFNQSVANFNTSNVNDMSRMFTGCSVFNQSVSAFSTSQVTTMADMFNGCTNFNQDVSNFNIVNIIDMGYMLASSAFSNANYDLLLVAWEAQTEKPNVPFHAGTAKYSAGAPATARAALVANGWTITDSGQA